MPNPHRGKIWSELHGDMQINTIERNSFSGKETCPLIK